MKTNFVRLGMTALLAALLMMGWQALFLPHRAEAIPCGAGEDECTAEESDGYDSFCLDLWWIFEFCYDVTYYHPPEPPPSAS